MAILWNYKLNLTLPLMFTTQTSDAWNRENQNESTFLCIIYHYQLTTTNLKTDIPGRITTLKITRSCLCLTILKFKLLKCGFAGLIFFLSTWNLNSNGDTILQNKLAHCSVLICFIKNYFFKNCVISVVNILLFLPWIVPVWYRVIQNKRNYMVGTTAVSFT